MITMDNDGAVPLQSGRLPVRFPDPLVEELEANLPQLTAIRRDIHAHPELGNSEVHTAALITGLLRRWRIAVTENVGGFGVVGSIEGRVKGPRAIALRADMDALAIQEQTGLPYASRCPGRMHACGHDGHVAMLLGAAQYLAKNPIFQGRVHVIFQPAEEGRGGARAMLADGLFERFPCDAVYGMHTMPGLPAGEFAIRRGTFLASVCKWQVRFVGSGGHGGAPSPAADVTAVLGRFLTGLQAIVSRHVALGELAIINVGHVSGGSSESPGVRPATVVVGGTSRCFKSEVGEMIDRRLGELAHTVAAVSGCIAEVEITRRAPPLTNNPAQADISIAAARAVVGAARVKSEVEPLPIGEDFSLMLARRPGAYLLIGNGGNPDRPLSALHSSRFDFNDEILPLGVAYWVRLVEQELGLPRVVP